jgi:hypothetical protein
MRVDSPGRLARKEVLLVSCIGLERGWWKLERWPVVEIWNEARA